jgi:hypothetical protein
VEGGGGGAEGDDVDEGVVEQARVKLRVCGGENDGEDQEDFEESGELAEDAGREWAVAGDQNDDDGDGEHEDVAADDDNGGPPGDARFIGEDDEGLSDQQLVGDGVEVGAERRVLIEFAREQAVDGVAEAGDNENEQRPAIALIRDKSQKDREETETEQSDLVGYGEDPSTLLHVQGG